MISIATGEDALEAQTRLREALGTSSWLLASELIPPVNVDSTSLDLSVEWSKLFLSCWSEDLIQTWHVTGFETLEGEMRLKAHSRTVSKPQLITLTQAEWGKEHIRASYLRMIRKLLCSTDPALRIESASIGGLRWRQIRKGYARLVMRRLDRLVLAIGASRLEQQGHIEGLIEAGILWISRFNAVRSERARSNELILLIPTERAQVLIDRLMLLSTAHLGVTIRCIEVDEVALELRPVTVASQGELFSTHPRRVIWPAPDADGPGFWEPQILALAPDIIELRRTADAGDRFLINGLTFARGAGKARASYYFGLDQRVRLTRRTFPALEELVREIARIRRAGSPEPASPIYRLGAEAWLESIIRRDIRAFDPTLAQDNVYCQVPTWRGNDRSVLDLLAITTAGRLAVIEIKAGEDDGLPLQGLDYWLRVEEARRQGEFARRGFFSSVTIKPVPPLLFLVTPQLRFHRTFREISKCLVPEVEAYAIAINSNWRSRLRVLSRSRVNG